MVKKIKEIIWTDPAKFDLQEIYVFYSKNVNLHTAEKIIVSIIDYIEILFKNPEAGPCEEFLKHKSELFRYLVCGNYKIIYRIKENIIVIDAVFDCRQNPSKMELA